MIWPWYKLKIKITSLLIDLKTDVRCNKICLRYVLKFTILDYIVLSTYGMECPLLLSLVRMSVAVPELYHVAPLAAALLLLAAQLIHCSTSCRPKRSKIIFGKNPRTEWEHLCKLRKLALSLFYKPITGEGFFFFFLTLGSSVLMLITLLVLKNVGKECLRLFQPMFLGKGKSSRMSKRRFLWQLTCKANKTRMHRSWKRHNNSFCFLGTGKAWVAEDWIWILFFSDSLLSKMKCVACVLTRSEQ